MAAWPALALLAEPLDDRVVCLRDVVEVDVVGPMRLSVRSTDRPQVFAAAVPLTIASLVGEPVLDVGVGELRGDVLCDEEQRREALLPVDQFPCPVVALQDDDRL